MHVAKWLDALRGTQTLAAIAGRTRLSRFSVGRFLAGRSQPRLSQFLELIDALTERLPDFVQAWLGIERVPSLAARYERVSAARDAMFNQPLCEFFRGARAVAAASEPTEMAGLLLVQLLSWEPARLA